MASRIKLFSLTILIITGISSKSLFAQNQVSSFNSSDTAKTVAIYSSKKSFFKDYPVDTLVAHLNSLNNNPKVVYYKSTEDQSRTGFYADYLIDLNLTMKMPTVEAPKWETIERTSPQSVRVARPDGSYEDRIQYITTRVEKYIEASYKPGEGEVLIKIIQKHKNEKVTNKHLSATNLKEQDLKLVLIIGLIEYFLDNFSKF